jgi:hypothetical protein
MNFVRVVSLLLETASEGFRAAGALLLPRTRQTNGCSVNVPDSRMALFRDRRRLVLRGALRDDTPESRVRWATWVAW